MADVTDRADDEIELNLAEALRARRPVGPAPKGVCLYCDEVVEDQRRWCNADCRGEWERRRV
jgi:hypothetical protein